MKMKSGTLVVLVGVTALVIGGVLGHMFTRCYFILGDKEELLLQHMALENEALIHLSWLEASGSTDRQAMEEGLRRAALDSLQRYLEDVEFMGTVPGIGADWRFADRVKAYLDQHSGLQPKGDSPTTSPG
jgi:hypothetical protein